MVIFHYDYEMKFLSSYFPPYGFYCKEHFLSLLLLFIPQLLHALNVYFCLSYSFSHIFSRIIYYSLSTVLVVPSVSVIYVPVIDLDAIMGTITHASLQSLYSLSGSISFSNVCPCGPFGLHHVCSCSSFSLSIIRSQHHKYMSFLWSQHHKYVSFLWSQPCAYLWFLQSQPCV